MAGESVYCPHEYPLWGRGSGYEYGISEAGGPAFYARYFCERCALQRICRHRRLPARRAVAQSLAPAMNRSPKSDVGGVSGVRITGSDHRDEFATNNYNKLIIQTCLVDQIVRLLCMQT